MPDGWQQPASALQCTKQRPGSSFAGRQARQPVAAGMCALPLTTLTLTVSAQFEQSQRSLQTGEQVRDGAALQAAGTSSQAMRGWLLAGTCLSEQSMANCWPSPLMASERACTLLLASTYRSVSVLNLKLTSVSGKP